MRTGLLVPPARGVRQIAGMSACALMLDAALEVQADTRAALSLARACAHTHTHGHAHLCRRTSDRVNDAST